MFNYSIMRLAVDRIDCYCQDIRRQIKDGICTMPLFMMTLTPEGDPAIDKAGMLTETYRLYKERLDAEGLRSGVLIQASIGHGWVLNQPSAFTKYVNLTDGASPEICCPYDKEFRRYIRKAARTIASAHPDHIMLDDDFRLTFRPGRGCACALHMAEFNRRAGTAFTREDLLAAIKAKDENSARYEEIFVGTQIDSLVECAREIRAGIDEADPTLPGSFCACGDGTEGAYEIAAIMAGKGNPVTVRLNNANYCTGDPRDFAQSLHRAAAQIASLKGKPDVLLAETDTCPQNRYSTPAAKLHSHFTFTILEGAKGAKHWITRLGTFEPSSGEAYRKKLAKYRGFYEALSDMNDTLTWLGCRIPVPPRSVYAICPGERHASEHKGWRTTLLDRLGLPMHFSGAGKGAVFFDGDADVGFTDEELTRLLAGVVVLDAPAAERFIARGFGKYLGVDLRRRAANERNASGEMIFEGVSTAAQAGAREIIPLSSNVKQHSTVYYLRDGKYYDMMFPGVTSYRNELGGTAVVFGGETAFPYAIVGGAFSFLNETRKKQMAEILTDLGVLPAYYPGDLEMLMKAAETEDGALFLALLDMSLDPVEEELPLVIYRDVTRIRRLTPTGEYEDVAFTRDGDLYTLSLSAGVFDPLILLAE